MRVTVRVFAGLRDLIGTDEAVRDLTAPAVVRDVWRSLVREHPSLEAYTAAVSVAVNTEYSRMDAPVTDGDEIAFLPPVSGGSGARVPARRIH